MKSKSQPWFIFGTLFLLGFISRLPAEIKPTEAAASVQLVDALNASNYVAALEILHGFGVTNTTLEAMAAQLGRPPHRLTLTEPFLNGYLLLGDLGEGHKQDRRVRDAVAINYPTPLWVVDEMNRSLWRERAYKDWDRNLVPPIGVMNLRSAEQVIRYFKWYNRYAERLHSVSLNWYHINNYDGPGHAEAYRILNAMCQLVKARKPDAFVWLLVERPLDDSDIAWVQTMRFAYDGLLVGNLRDFSAHFQETRQRYLPYVGEGTPMVLTSFYGYEAPLERAGALTEGRAAAMLAVGKVLAPELRRKERHLQELGYRGLVVDWRVVEAVAFAEGVATK